MQRTLFVACLLMGLLPATVHGIRGLKLLQDPNGTNGLTLTDCQAEHMGKLYVDLGAAPTPPNDYEVILPLNFGGVNVLTLAFDPLVEGDVSAGVVLSDNYGLGGRYEGSQTPAELIPGSLGVSWAEQRNRDVTLQFNCEDCTGQVSVELIQRTWHGIAFYWYSNYPLHHVETATDVDSTAGGAGYKPLFSEDQHLSGDYHILVLAFDHWTHGGVTYYGGTCNVVIVDASGGVSSGSSTMKYKQREWNSSAAFPAPTEVTATGGSAGQVPSGPNDWGMSSYDPTLLTDFDFIASVEANFSSTTPPYLVDCNSTLNLPAMLGADVSLLVTDRGFNPLVRPNPNKKSEVALNIKYGSYVFVWQVKVTRNCDNGGLGCPCLKYGPDGDTGQPNP